MKKIETLEQRNKAIAWMVEQANHPLEPAVNDEKTRKLYDYIDLQVQQFNAEHFSHQEFPEEQEEEKDLGGWLD